MKKENWTICKNCNTIIRIVGARYCTKCGKPLSKYTEEDGKRIKIVRYYRTQITEIEHFKILNEEFNNDVLTCEVYYNGKPISELKEEEW